MASGRSASDFSDATSYLDDATSTVVDISSNPISGVVWFYPTTGSGAKNIVSQNGGTGTNEIFIQRSNTDTVSNYIGGTLDGATTLSTNTWYHFGFTFAGGTGTCQVTLNGASDASGSRTGAAADGVYILGANPGGNVGANDPCAWGMLFDVELSVEQINEIQYQPFAFPENVIWMPDLLQDGTYRDLSKDQNGNPTVNGTVNAYTEGPPVFLLGGQ